MRFRRLGKTNLRVSVIGLGTFQFGGSWGKQFTRNEVADIVSAARDSGVNLIDTAECYGADHLAESLVGSAIASSRNHWILATKFGHFRQDPSHKIEAWDTASVRKQLEASLHALGTDYIDIYQFHSGSNEDFENDELWMTLRRLKQSGKVRFLGISLSNKKSEWRTHQTKRAVDVGADIIQVKLNRLARVAETEVLPECLDRELGVMARVPLASGLLSGKYQDLSAFPDADIRSEKYQPQQIRHMQEEIERIVETELPDGASLPEYALTWCLSHDAVSCVVAGCKTVKHVLANAAVAASSLMPAHHPQDLP